MFIEQLAQFRILLIHRIVYRIEHSSSDGELLFEAVVAETKLDFRKALRSYAATVMQKRDDEKDALLESKDGASENVSLLLGNQEVAVQAEADSVRGTFAESNDAEVPGEQSATDSDLKGVKSSADRLGLGKKSVKNGK